MPSTLKHSLSIAFLTAIFSVSLAGTAYATTGCNAAGWGVDEVSFSDVRGCTLYYPAIHWLQEQGIAQGVGTKTDGERPYEPTRTINRAEFTKLVLLTSGVQNPPACVQSPFPDVPKDAWFAPYICAAKDRGIISGFPDGTFKPAIDVNFANGAKILAKTFNIPVDSHDANLGGQDFSDQPSVWYRPYTLGLLRKRAVAPTVREFTQSLTRGEMAEMLYRLATGENYFDKPLSTGDGDYLGYGLGPYDLEQPLGLSISGTPDPPYVFAPHEYSFTWLSKDAPHLKGYAFSHVLQQERCSLSGLWEHCKPTFADWSIQLYVTAASVDTLKKEIREMSTETERYFGGKPGQCFTAGVEGDYTEYCFVPLAQKKTFIVIREYIDTSAWGVADAMSLEKSDAMYARIRKSITFIGQ